MQTNLLNTLLVVIIYGQKKNYLKMFPVVVAALCLYIMLEFFKSIDCRFLHPWGNQSVCFQNHFISRVFHCWWNF